MNGGALFRRRDLFGQMVGRHKYQMIQPQQPHGQEHDQQQQHETMRKQHETTIHRDMQEGGWGQADDDKRWTTTKKKTMTPLWAFACSSEYCCYATQKRGRIGMDFSFIVR